MEFFRGLKDKGTPTELWFYPREGHGFTEYYHQIDKIRREYDWIAKNTLAPSASSTAQASLPFAPPPPSHPDYAKADLIRTSGAFVLNATGTPIWLQDSTRCYYRSASLHGETAVYLVDPVKRTRVPLFDNAHLAQVMSLAGDTVFDPIKIPNRRLSDDEPAGFIVIQLDHMGTPKRSKAFHDFYCGCVDQGQQGFRLDRAPGLRARAPAVRGPPRLGLFCAQPRWARAATGVRDDRDAGAGASGTGRPGRSRSVAGSGSGSGSGGRLTKARTRSSRLLLRAASSLAALRT